MTDDTSTSDEKKQQQTENKEQHYQRIGAELRRRREAISLEQGDVARQLHLPGMVVNDIESGQVENLSSIYRRGYIRNYARLLELDPDELLADAGEDVPPELKEVLPVSKGSWRLERYLKIATYALVTVAIVPPLVYFFIAGGMRVLERDPASSESREVAGSTQSQLSEVSTSSGVAEVGKPESAPSTAPHVSASALPLNPVRPVREPSPEPASDAGTSSTEAQEAEAGPALSALEVELLEDSWVEIHDAEGTRLEYDLLRSGQKRNYEGQAPFRLLVGRSSAVRLHVNGHSVTWDGHDSGDVAELAVTANGEVQP
ncbi:MAG: DUF4115 domain-containing protein [Xanthomonadales bacterium]|nr:DUF4115 domain-containing protein [Xanthomonadales bacterium]